MNHEAGLRRNNDSATLHSGFNCCAFGLGVRVFTKPQPKADISTTDPEAQITYTSRALRFFLISTCRSSHWLNFYYATVEPLENLRSCAASWGAIFNPLISKDLEALHFVPLDPGPVRRGVESLLQCLGCPRPIAIADEED